MTVRIALSSIEEAGGRLVFDIEHGGERRSCTMEVEVVRALAGVWDDPLLAFQSQLPVIERAAQYKWRTGLPDGRPLSITTSDIFLSRLP